LFLLFSRNPRCPFIFPPLANARTRSDFSSVGPGNLLVFVYNIFPFDDSCYLSSARLLVPPKSSDCFFSGKNRADFPGPSAFSPPALSSLGLLFHKQLPLSLKFPRASCSSIALPNFFIFSTRMLSMSFVSSQPWECSVAAAPLPFSHGLTNTLRFSRLTQSSSAVAVPLTLRSMRASGPFSFSVAIVG